jgi:hypothetical protein
MSAGQLLSIVIATSVGWTIGNDLIPLVIGWLL